MGLTEKILTGAALVALWLVGVWLWDWYYNRRHRNRDKQ